jgi:hypothetical protein
LVGQRKVLEDLREDREIVLKIELYPKTAKDGLCGPWGPSAKSLKVWDRQWTLDRDANFSGDPEDVKSASMRML